MRLKKAIAAQFPNVEISCRSASSQTGLIEVSWINAGNKNKVWSKGRGDTENNHAQIIADLKSTQN